MISTVHAALASTRAASSEEQADAARRYDRSPRNHQDGWSVFSLRGTPEPFASQHLVGRLSCFLLGQDPNLGRLLGLTTPSVHQPRRRQDANDVAVGRTLHSLMPWAKTKSNEIRCYPSRFLYIFQRRSLARLAAATGQVSARYLQLDW